MATLHLMVGLPGVGKTTLARRIEVEGGALRLTKDEWMKALYGTENPPAASDVIEGRLVEIALRSVEVHHLHLPPEEQRRRIDRRQAEEPDTTRVLSEDDAAAWTAFFQVPTPGEADGTEPVDPPPDGFASWDAWRHDRWPAALA